MIVQVSSDCDPLISRGESWQEGTFVFGQKQPNPANYSKKTPLVSQANRMRLTCHHGLTRHRLTSHLMFILGQ